MQKSVNSADNPNSMSGASELSDFFSRVPVALYRTDESGNLLVANHALATLLGYEDHEHLESALEDVSSVYVDPSERKRWIDVMEEKGIVFDFDVELKRADGSTIWVQDTARAIRDANGDLLYYEGALIDVTEKVKATRAREEFLATVSHELRNPIAVVVGLSHELATRYDAFDETERREMTTMIARQADDASWLIEDLLVVYRDDVSEVSITPEQFEIGEAVEQVLEVVPRKVELAVGDADMVVLADPRRTRQIVRNLINNAVSYGGQEIVVRIESHDGAVRVRVCDNGDPITGAEAQEIFEIFRRGSREAHPTSVGLGLPVARRLARLMGGDVTYTYEDGYSIFTLDLPEARSR